jgi:hypothetical protein
VGRRGLVGVLGVAILLAFTNLASAKVPWPGRFDGSTDQAYPNGGFGTVTIKMTQKGRRIEGFDITWLAPCDSGFSTLSQGTHAEGSVTRKGKFRGSGSYQSDQGNLAGTQYTATITDSLRGRFTGKGAGKGTFQATAVLHDASGKQVSTCTSPPIRWKAKHVNAGVPSTVK